MTENSYSAEWNLHIKIMRTAAAASPQVFNGHVFFTHKPSAVLRYVGIAFAHENYRTLHLLQRNERGVFFLAYPIPEGRTFLDYRMVIDGLWTKDPMNPQFYRDPSGITISRVEFPPEVLPADIRSPIVRPREQTVVFNFQGESGRVVYLTGSFAHWDPFLYRMPEVRPGLYSLSLRLLPGTYWYAFVVDGKQIRDALNRDWGADAAGREASVLVVPPRSN